MIGSSINLRRKISSMLPHPGKRDIYRNAVTIGHFRPHPRRHAGKQRRGAIDEHPGCLSLPEHGDPCLNIHFIPTQRPYPGKHIQRGPIRARLTPIANRGLLRGTSVAACRHGRSFDRVGLRSAHLNSPRERRQRRERSALTP